MSIGLDARWPEVDALLDAVLDQPVESRERWLQAHCPDPELRNLVSSLLAADARRADALEARAEAAHDWLAARAVALPRIPGYRVLQLLGEGGMASVFLAERQLGETVQRVALKRLRLNVYDPTERRRFEREHRVLARLEHPHIAHLLDAGIAPDGVPWFAMEYVEGEALIAWCDARKLGTDARLALFVDICTAVQHAHQHLVVHRDLKPSNILVDGHGRAKLLDFGIARLLDPDTDRPEGTRTELRRLTPGYAAPEQYTGHATTATDIYALGVILVELLGGSKPRPSATTDDDPLQNLAITPEAAEVRGTTPRAIKRLLAGDLGTIVRKATRATPALRYTTAQALADDVTALRTGRAVAARRGDGWYRARRFLGRNKTAAIATALVAVTLVVTTAISVRQAREARAQATRAHAVQDFITGMLAPLRAGTPAARMPRLDEVLAQGVRDLDLRPRDPTVYSELMTLFANTYAHMGDLRTAETLARRVHAHNTKAFGDDDPRTLSAWALRVRMQRGLRGTNEHDRAEIEAILARMRRSGIQGVPLAEVLDDLGHHHLGAGHSREATPLFTEALKQRERALGPDHPDLAISHVNIGMAEFAYAPEAVSRAWYDKAYRHTVRHLGADSRQAAFVLGRIGASATYAGQLREATRHYQAALAVFERLGERAHPDLLSALTGYCTNAVQLDELQRAQGHCDAAVSLARQMRGEGSTLHATFAGNHFYLLVAQGRLHDARTVAARSRAVLDTKQDEISRSALQRLRANVSELQVVEGDYLGMRDDLLAALKDNFGGRLPRLIPVWTARLALACARMPSPACPSDLDTRLQAQLAAPELRLHPRRIEAQLPLAQLALDRGRIAQAHAYLDSIEAVAAQPHLRYAPSHRLLAEARMLRGEAFAAQGDRAAAVREWQAAEAVFVARYPADHPFRRRLAGHLRPVVATAPAQAPDRLAR